MAKTRLITNFFLCGLLSFGLITQANAQNRVSPPEHNPFISFASVLSVLEQVGIIIPGKGFNSIGLGDSINQLVQRWGKPKQTEPGKSLTYQLDSKTLIQFFGKERIEHIVILGLPGSLARTQNQVIFGMSLVEARSQFLQAASRSSKSVLRYDDLGIELHFEASILARIEVFAPSR